MDPIIFAIELAASCYDSYRRAPDALRRIYNQAFFNRILIWEEEPASGELQDLFELVLTASPETQAQERQETENTGFSASKGSKDEHLVPREGFEPPTRSLGRSGSSTELQRLARRFYPGGAPAPAPPPPSSAHRRYGARCVE